MRYNAENNKDKLSLCLNDIGEMFNGLKTPLSIYTGGENGIANEEKINEFAERLVSSQCNLFGYFVGISGIQRRHIQLLCYLILRAFDPDDDTLDFADFLRDAKQLDECKCREKHIIAAYENNVITGGIYNNGIMRRIKNSCMLLTGRCISDDFSEAEIIAMRETIRARDRNNARLKKKCEEQIASSERIEASAADELRERYEEYGIEGETDYREAMDNEYDYLYGNSFWDSEQENRSLFSFSRKLGRRRTAAEEEAWQVQRKELEDKWKKSFADPEEYLRAFREFIEINTLVHEFSINHPLDESVMELLAKDKYDITDCNDDFLKYFSELNRIPRILKRGCVKRAIAK